MTTTNHVKNWIGVLLTEDSSFHCQPSLGASNLQRRAGLEFVCVLDTTGKKTMITEKLRLVSVEPRPEHFVYLVTFEYQITPGKTYFGSQKARPRYLARLNDAKLRLSVNVNFHHGQRERDPRFDDIANAGRHIISEHLSDLLQALS